MHLIKVYDFCRFTRYYVGLGLSVLCTFLFVLFIIGLAGICANRTQNNFKQSCHRGIYANFLLSGSGIYFIFAIVIAVCCVAFSSVGILTRHFVCNTAIDLNHSPVYKVTFFIEFLERKRLIISTNS